MTSLIRLPVWLILAAILRSGESVQAALDIGPSGTGVQAFDTRPTLADGWSYYIIWGGPVLL